MRKIESWLRFFQVSNLYEFVFGTASRRFRDRSNLCFDAATPERIDIILLVSPILYREFVVSSDTNRSARAEEILQRADYKKDFAGLAF